MAGNDFDWYPIATVFPAGLDTETDITKLKDGFTPDGYMMDIDYPGRLVKASAAPTGSSQVTKTYDISGTTWSWFYRRLWLIATANLRYNAPEYTATDIPQDLGILSFDEDTGAIVVFLPFAGDSMFVTKATGGYRIPGASSLDGNFQHGDIQESMRADASANVSELNGDVYVSNEYGLMRWGGGDIEELTKMVRTNVATFTDKTLSIDFQKQRIIGASAFAFDVRDKKLFDFSQTAGLFRFTTRAIIAKDYKPFPVTGVGFQIDNTTEADGEIKFQARRDKGWEDELTIRVKFQEDERAFVTKDFEESPEARKFQIRVTDVSSHLHIRQIDVMTSLTSERESWSQ